VTLAATLTAVATLIVGHPVKVFCTHPAGMPWRGNEAGWTFRPPPRVFLRWCGATWRAEPLASTVFAHELLHVEHPGWSHPRVYRVAPRYARIVARVVRRHR